jgi:hypothetical protein
MRVCMYTPHVDMYNHVDNIYIYIYTLTVICIHKFYP